MTIVVSSSSMADRIIPLVCGIIDAGDDEVWKNNLCVRDKCMGLVFCLNFED
jgi:hypothetical protein